MTDRVARVTPTFFLKWICPKTLLKNYSESIFPSENKKLINLCKNTPFLTTTYGKSSEDGIFFIKDKNNGKIVVATSGNTDYIEMYHKNAPYPPIGGRCRSCLCDFQHQSLGYPLAYQEISILGGEPATYSVLYRFWCEDKFCCFECAYYYVKKMNIHDITTQDAEKLLKLMYRILYPNAGILLPINDPLLLKSNGGSLTEEEWKNKKHIYSRSSRVILTPAKVEYIRSDVKNFISLELQDGKIIKNIDDSI